MELRETWLHLVVVLAISLHVTPALIQSPPRIVKQPPTDELLFQVATQQNEKDKPFIIECEADGEPAPKYSWIKNGKNFDWQAYDDRISQQPGRGTLVITSPRDEDLGQYQCFAKNEWGTATSNSVFARKAELNSFKDEASQTLTAEEGSPFKLTCQPPDGWPKPDIYWLIQNASGLNIKSINNSRMTLDHEGNLWFSNVTRQDASEEFNYVCAATSVFRNEYKLGNRVLLNVVATGISSAQNRHEPVQQYVTRKSEVALRGKKVTLYCIFGGTPLPQTVWSKNGKPLQSSDRITQGNYGKSLIIKHVNFDDEGTYTCEVSNGVGDEKTYSINLQVMAVPYFTVEPEISNKTEGETVEFRCEASGVPEPQIKWIHNGLPITESPNNPRRKVTPNSIIIDRLEKSDIGNYGCNATNSLGYVYKDVYLNVLMLAPGFIEPPQDMSTVDGRTVTLTCRVFGAPKPQIKWVRNSLELTGGRYNILDSGDLEIRDVSFRDAGNYTCYTSNKLGNAEASGTLTVKERTKITDEPEDYEVPVGSFATFRCNAVSDYSLELKIDWLKNGELIDFDNEPRFLRSNDYSLIITKTTELDSGTYTCVASTQLDKAEAQATLTVQDVPNAPRLTEVVCNKRDASISWKPMGDNRAPVMRFNIQYNTTFTPDVWEVAFDSVPASDLTYAVPMSPWANYTFRVLAINKIGPSSPSGHSKVCTTQPDVPYKNPDNVEGKGTDPSNIVINWTPMPEIEHNAPGLRYRVSWKRDIPGESWNNEDISDWRKSELVIPNQPTFQPYRIKMIAINEKGVSNVAPREFIGYSGEDVPTQAPSNFTLVQVTAPNSALLSWNPVPLDTVRGHFKGYKVQTWTDKEGEAGMRDIHVKGDATRALVNRFVPHTKNYARVLVYNSRYNGPPSETLSFDTPEGAPGSIHGLEAFQMGSSALYLVWEKPEQENGVLTGYKIYYQTVKGTRVGPLMEREPHVNDPKMTRAKLAGLEPGTKYRLHVKATTNAGEGEDYFIEHRTRGSQSVPPDVPNFRLEQVAFQYDNGYGNVKVTWMPNLDGRPGSHFYVKYKLKNEPQYTISQNELYEDYFIVRQLNPGQTYEFKLVAVDGEYSTESETQELEIVKTDVVPNAPVLSEVVCNKQDASISWKPMGDNVVPILQFAIQYNTTFQPDVWEDACEPVPASDLNYTVAMRPWANYTFRVLAINKIGPSNPSGHSKVCMTQPDVPYKNPDNVEGKGTDPSNIVISWTPMPEIEHNAPGFHYRVSWKRDIPGESWNNEDISDWRTSELVIPNQPTFQPYRIKVIAINEKGESNVAPNEFIGYSGEDVPGSVDGLHAVAMGCSALYLVWNKPEQENGVLTGYKIYYETVSGGSVGPLMARVPHVSNPNTTHAKLTGLQHDTTYRLHVKATTNVGEGEDYFIERRTSGFFSVPPDVPKFRLEQLEFQNNHIKVTWVPNLNGRLGCHFYVKYKLKDESQYTISETELYEDHMIVGPLNPGQTYEFKLVAVDGEFSTESEIQVLETLASEERNMEDLSNSQYRPSSETNTDEPPTTLPSSSTSSYDDYDV